jgi:glycosyltransferase involved in cell wall biosynthesis
MGGAQALLLALLRELPAAGAGRNVVAAVTERWADPDLVGAIRATGARLEYLERGIADPRMAVSLARIARTSGAEVVHSHLSVSNVGSRAAARLLGLPHMATVHTMPGPLMEDSRARAFADGYSARLSAILAAPSVEVADAYSEAFRLRRSRFRVVPNAPATIDPGPFDRDALRHEIAPGAAQVVTCVARLQREKGIDELLEAARLLGERLPGARIVVAGDGPERERLEAALSENGAGQTLRLLGHRSDIARLLVASDAFVLPSRHEGLPISLLEAMAAGLPSVATAVGGIPGLVEDGRSGLLVEAQDPPALADALGRVLSDGALAARLGAEGRRVVEERHSPGAVARQYAALYRELARR